MCDTGAGDGAKPETERPTPDLSPSEEFNDDACEGGKCWTDKKLGLGSGAGDGAKP